MSSPQQQRHRTRHDKPSSELEEKEKKKRAKRTHTTLNAVDSSEEHHEPPPNNRSTPNMDRYNECMFGNNATLLTRTPAADFDMTKPTFVIDNTAGGTETCTADLFSAKLLFVSDMHQPEDAVSNNNKRITVMDEHKNILLHKCSARDRNNSIPFAQWDYHQATLRLTLKYQAPNRHFLHNDDRCCPWNSYMSFGYRQDFRNRRVHHYVGLSSDTPEEVKADLEVRLGKLVQDLEALSLSRFPPEHVEAMNSLKTEFQLDDAVINPNGGLATHISIAQGYWTSVQVDKETCSYLIISCLAHRFRNKNNREKILFYVVLPSCQVAIPMTSGDVLILDPAVPHCITEPREEDCFIILLHTSPKTYLAKLAENVAVDQSNVLMTRILI